MTDEKDILRHKARAAAFTSIAERLNSDHWREKAAAEMEAAEELSKKPEDEPLKEGIRLRPGMSQKEFNRARRAHDSPSISAAPEEKDVDENKMLAMLLKGRFPWGTVSSTLTKAALSKIRTMDPRRKNEAITSIWHSKEAFADFVHGGGR